MERETDVEKIKRELGGPDIQERAEWIAEFNLDYNERMRQYKAQGLSEEEAFWAEETENSGPFLSFSEQAMDSIGMYETNGTIYSTREERDAVRAVLHAAGMDHVCTEYPPAKRLLRAAGLD